METAVDPKTKFDYPSKLVLEYKEDDETPSIEVDKSLLKVLKPHQAEGNTSGVSWWSVSLHVCGFDSQLNCLVKTDQFK